jgi:N6-adenosine-specific RNA methylase IME4
MYDAPQRRVAARLTACCRRSVEAIIEAGRLLMCAKTALPHGEFRAMIESRLPFKLRTAEMLMAIYHDPRLVNSRYVAHLPPTASTLYELTRLPDEAFEARIADGTICPDMERRDVAATVKREARQRREADLGEKIEAGNLALPQKQYGIILADWPRKPWAWSDETGFDRAPDNHYATQTFRWAVNVFAPMIRRLAAPDAMLMLWSTAASLIDDIEIMAEAGFCALRPRGPDGRLLRDGDGEPLAGVSPGEGTYRSHQVWDKVLLGTGRWFRDRHELVLVGVRGRVPCPAPGTQALSLFAERRGEHSAKPDFVAAEIDRLWPHIPKIELFRRGAARPGWDAFGDGVTEEPPHDPDTGEIIEASAASVGCAA